MARKRTSTGRSSSKGRSTSSQARKGRGKKQGPAIRWPSLDTQLDVLGILLLGAGLVTGLSMLNPPSAAWIVAWLNALRDIFGWGQAAVPIFLAGVGVWLIARRFEFAPAVPWARLLGVVLLGLIGLAVLTFLSEWQDPEATALPGGAGGLLGWAVLRGLRLALGTWGALIAIAILGVIGALLILELSVAELRLLLAQRRERDPAPPLPPVEPLDLPQPEPSAPRIIVNNTPVEDLPASPKSEDEPAPERPAPPKKGRARSSKKSRSQDGGAKPSQSGAGEVVQPPLVASVNGVPWEMPAWRTILEDVDEQDLNAQDIRQKVRIIEDTLEHFGVPSRVIEVSQGPTVTQFGVEPGFVVKRVRGEERRVKVKVSAITSLANDLALALAASSIRVEAPVPGRPFVGIEVPNEEKNVVSLRGIMETTEFQRIKSPLRIALGRDVSGGPVVAALDKMPHLLIAGATGSGKSVCVNTIIACLLCNNHPDQLKLVMVDPKRVELVGYNGIPHLITPVVVETEKVVAILRWAVKEMERRYQLFSQAGARNIQSFNEKATRKGEQALPYIVIIIDELADLMMVAAEEVERLVCRLAQMARATGMHLILATQRPSVDVVTGLIKANFPARIAFAVTSGIDSRVILDRQGAETLLGRGDMLYQASDAGSPIRAQGCYVSDRELERIIMHWIDAKKAAAAAEARRAAAGEGQELANSSGTGLSAGQSSPGVQPPRWEELVADTQPGEDDEDDLLPMARQIVQQQGRASISLLQRRLRVGYARAARLIDLLEEEGTIGAADGPGRAREVYVEKSGPGEENDPGWDPSRVTDD